MTSEREDWVDGIAHGLIRHAARRAPDSLSERLEEEWLADLAAQRGAMARIRFALGCCWAMNIIAHEHVAVAALPASASPMRHGASILGPQDDFPFFSGRTITFVLVASLHAAVLYGLAMGLGPQFSKIIAGPLVARVIETPPHTDLPPPPRARVSTTKIDLPPQERMPPIETDTTDVVRGAPSDGAPPVLPPAQPEVHRVQGGPGVGFPSTGDFYPDASIRMGEKGAGVVQACVDGQGRLIAEPTIIQSTGSARLDEAAVKLAKAGSGHYRATTENGRPVNSCYPFRIRFDLRN